MGRVAAGRTPRIGQPAGERQAARIVDGQSQGVATQSQRRREAGVQVERVDLVKTHPGGGERTAPRHRHRRRARHVVALGDTRRVLRIGPAAQVEPSIRGHAERIGLAPGGHQQRRRHVDVHHCDLVFGIRPAHVAVLRAGSSHLCRAQRDRSPRVRIRCRDNAHRGHRRRRLRGVVGQRRAASGPAGGIPQRKRLPGLQHLVVDLGGVGRLPWERRGLAMAPRQPPAALLRHPGGCEGFGAADQRQVQLPCPHRLRGPVDQVLRCRAADSRVQPMRGEAPAAVRQPAGGVVVGPGSGSTPPGVNRSAAVRHPRRQRRPPPGPAVAS